MSETAESRPLPTDRRIATLDVLRGFALMGILIMNMPGFSYSGFHESDGSRHWPGAIDQFAEAARDLLFSGKFNSMFSLLFGIGFTIQFARLQQAEPARATAIYLRRLEVLLALGLAHVTLLWFGDVLHVYAILGIVLVLGLRHVSDRALLWIIGGCLVYPLVSGALRLVVFTPEIVKERVARGLAFAASNDAAFGQGGWTDAVRENLAMLAYEYGDPLALWGNFGWYVSLALTMLIGVYAGRRRWPQRIPELMPHIRRWTWVLLVVGLACGAAFTAIFAFNRVPGPSPIKLLGSLCYGISRLATMLFYVLAIVQLAQRPAWQPAFGWLAAAGRMPLTNYLMQSLICCTLFYSWGFGLWDRVGPAAGFGLSLAIFFGIQVPWSRWWLARHDRGPLESAWARLTYGRRPVVAAPEPRRL